MAMADLRTLTAKMRGIVGFVSSLPARAIPPTPGLAARAKSGLGAGAQIHRATPQRKAANVRASPA